MKYLVALLLTLCFGAAEGAEFSIVRQYSRVLLMVKSVDGKDIVVGSGSTINISPNLAVTAAHNIPKDGSTTIYVSTGTHGTVAKATVLKIDRSVDLALISSPGIECPCPSLAEDTIVDETAWIVGFPKYTRYSTQFVTVGNIQGRWQDHIIATPSAAAGASGGGLFVKRGREFQLAGIVVGIGVEPQAVGIQDIHWITMSIPGARIRSFLKGTTAEQ